MGAREHYSIPRSLHAANELALLVTDAWADGLLPWKLGPRSRARERFHPDIPRSHVASFDWSLLRFETLARRRASGWSLIVQRNEWFQQRALGALQQLHRDNPDRHYTLFSYSYAARTLFEFAKEAGWSTVLGQMDPGPFEEAIVTRLNNADGSTANAVAAPAGYWDSWRQECRLADRIVVNSPWAWRGLCSDGVPSAKLRLVPLAYDPPSEARQFVRTFPSAFTAERPLRILFLGQVNLRKGVAEIIGALPKLQGLPVEFWMVGPVQLTVSDEQRAHPQMKWFGAVPRGSAANYYRDADIFLFPTFSDGFGLTQLEAQACKLPIIASEHCGSVVEHLRNGYILPEVTPAAVAEAVRWVLANPGMLAEFAMHSRSDEFTHSRLIASLSALKAEF